MSTRCARRAALVGKDGVEAFCDALYSHCEKFRPPRPRRHGPQTFETHHLRKLQIHATSWERGRRVQGGVRRPAVRVFFQQAGAGEKLLAAPHSLTHPHSAHRATRAAPSDIHTPASRPDPVGSCPAFSTHARSTALTSDAAVAQGARGRAARVGGPALYPTSSSLPVFFVCVPIFSK